MTKHKKNPNTIARNKKARFQYEIKETVEAGIVLQGSEIKSIRVNKANIDDAYAECKDNHLQLYNVHIPPYKHSSYNNHTPNRIRTLLLHKKQTRKLQAATKTKGMTIVVLSMYFNTRGFVKLEIGLAQGKKLHDKRADEKKRTIERESRAALKSL